MNNKEKLVWTAALVVGWCLCIYAPAEGFK